MVSEITPAQTQKALEKQAHFYNDNFARKRGRPIIILAQEILNRPRGSPTAKEKVPKLQKIAREEPIRGETDFQMELLAVLLNNARTVPKAGFAPGEARNVEDFAPDPVAWDKDFLGRRTNARFRADSVPQVKAADKSFEQMFKSFPRIQIPEPDILYGLSANTLPEDYCDFFANGPVKALTKGIHHPFLAVEIGTKDRPIAEAETQCQRTGSAMVFALANWNAAVNGETFTGTITKLPEVDIDKHSSTPDPDTFCFSVALSPSACFMLVNWRECWSNGAVHWHTSVLDTYSLEYGMDFHTERFQRHVSNIINWGLCERGMDIYKQAQALVKGKFGDTKDLPLPTVKRKRTDATDDSE